MVIRITNGTTHAVVNIQNQTLSVNQYIVVYKNTII